MDESVNRRDGRVTRRIRWVALLWTILFLSLFSSLFAAKREMRAVWMATVANIDWPSEKGLPVETQQRELRRYLDSFSQNGINTVIFQIRPSADALYDSQIEPWSLYLNGRQGLESNPYYDPLSFLIAEAHSRCMEVHVWINPYRATMFSNTSSLDASHALLRHPEWFVKYNGRFYFNPGMDETHEYLCHIVEDVVRRYDVDAVVFDDYFYPYPVPGETFQDLQTFRENPRGFSSIDDWRRDNVDRTIQAVSETVRHAKPWVQFGISPFGVWRHRTNDVRGSETMRGLQNYDDLYADVLKWMEKGWIDYVAPQLYWEIGKRNADYGVLLPWWIANTPSDRTNLYISLYASFPAQKMTAPAWQRPNELVRQMRLNRSFGEQVKGEMFYSAKYFVRNIQGLNDSLQQFLYSDNVLTPPAPRIASGDSAFFYVSPQPRNVRLERSMGTQDDGNDEVMLTWDAVCLDSLDHGLNPLFYAVYVTKREHLPDGTASAATMTMPSMTHPTFLTHNTAADLTPYVSEEGEYDVCVTTFNRYRMESEQMQSVRFVQPHR